jgi:hypothetical protein
MRSSRKRKGIRKDGVLKLTSLPTILPMFAGPTTYTMFGLSA